MANERHGLAIWPGAQSVISATYTIGQGISPGTCVYQMLPQPVFPDMFGDLVITDGIGTVTIPACKVDGLKVDHGSSGITWSLEIVDRRWRWKELGSISGTYNQLDPHGKLIPWMIRSPFELAVLCLQAMGETGYVIDMPAGLASGLGAGQKDFLKVGENFPPVGINPPVDWQQEPPAQALARLCDQCGRRVVYNLATNSVWIVRPGVGANLPDGSIAKEGPALKSPETPDGITVAGVPVRYQMRLGIQPVGEEWDGSYKPIDALSYAPVIPGKVQITTVTISQTAEAFADGNKFNLWLFGNGEPAFAEGTLFEAEPNGASTDTDMAASLVAKVNASASPKVKGFLNAANVGAVITLTGSQAGVPFDVEGRMSPNPTRGKMDVKLVQAAQRPGKSWDFAQPPLYPGIIATDRLTYAQALSLAQKSVWKCYQVNDVDVTGKGRINVPGYGKLLRRQQIVLTDTQVDQIVPLAVDKNLLDARGQPLVVNFYNGYSRDKPAACYGSISRFLQQAILLDIRDANTPENSQVFVEFSVDPTYQLVIFSSPVYRVGAGGSCKDPQLKLQTAVNIRNPLNNQLEVFSLSERLPSFSGTNYAVQKHPDLQLNVTSTYADDGTIKTVDILEADPLFRARYYLDGQKLQYIPTGAQQIEYNGIVAIALDGAIAQVTWSVGESGCSTSASRNTEHSLWIPPYPARRRAELLAPAVAPRPPERIQLP